MLFRIFNSFIACLLQLHLSDYGSVGDVAPASYRALWVMSLHTTFTFDLMIWFDSCPRFLLCFLRH